MELLLNIIVLLFEVLYYSLFMKFSRKEGNFWRYITLFTIITFVGLIIGTNNLPSYLVLVILMLLGIKYIVKIKTSLYDMLFIIIILFSKILIETPIYIILYNFINNYVIGIIVGLIKLLLIVFLRKKLYSLYKYLKIKWDSNNFYIRYIFGCSMFVYVIITIILLIKLMWEV